MKKQDTLIARKVVGFAELTRRFCMLAGIIDDVEIARISQPYVEMLIENYNIEGVTCMLMYANRSVKLYKNDELLKVFDVSEGATDKVIRCDGRKIEMLNQNKLFSSDETGSNKATSVLLTSAAAAALIFGGNASGNGSQDSGDGFGTFDNGSSDGDNSNNNNNNNNNNTNGSGNNSGSGNKSTSGSSNKKSSGSSNKSTTTGGSTGVPKTGDTLASQMDIMNLLVLAGSFILFACLKKKRENNR